LTLSLSILNTDFQQSFVYWKQVQSSKMELALQPIHKELVPSASMLLSEAFYDNPAHTFFCANPNKRKAQLKWILGANLGLQLQHGAASFCLSEKYQIPNTKAFQKFVLALGIWNLVFGIWSLALGTWNLVFGV